MREKKLDLYAAVVIFLVGIFIYANSFSISSLTNMTIGPDFMPKVVSGGMMVLSLILGINAVSAIRKQVPGAGNPERESEPIVSKRFLATVIVIFGYFLLLKPLGYLIATAIYAFLHFMLLTAREEWKKKWIFCLILALVVSAGTYYVFRSGFNLMLPEGILK